MTDLATLQTRLTEAEAAHHSLMTGSMAETIARDGNQVRYMASDSQKLVNYIAALKREIAAISDVPGARRRRAITVGL